METADFCAEMQANVFPECAKEITIDFFHNTENKTTNCLCFDSRIEELLFLTVKAYILFILNNLVDYG